MSSLNEMSTDQLGNRVVVRGEELLRPPPPLSTAGFNQIFKRRRERFFLHLGNLLRDFHRDHTYHPNIHFVLFQMSWEENL